MSRAAGCRDEDLGPAAFALVDIFHGFGRRAMGREDAAFVPHAAFVERLMGGLHCLPIGLAAHQDGNERGVGRHAIDLRVGV
jgi:hypothetical protein